MTISFSMEEIHNRLTEKILDLTLEIIYLLTGEIFTTVKSGDLVAIMVPPQQFVIPKWTNKKRILGVINKMVGLLRGEDSENSNNYHMTLRKEIKMEDGGLAERTYLEGHEELYKAAMMDEEPTDGSRKRHPPASCPLPPYSQGSIQEEFTNQRGTVEETIIREQPAMRGEDMASPVRVKEEEGSPESSRDGDLMTHLEGHQMLSPNWDSEDGDLTQDSSEENSATPIILSELPTTHQSLFLASPAKGISDEPKTATQNSKCRNGKRFPCSECGKCYTQKWNLVAHQRLHTGEGLLSCSECGKDFVSKLLLVKHQQTHTGQKPYSCTECGQCFTRKSTLTEHDCLHRGIKPFKCAECGKSFARKWNVTVHKRSHTGERPYKCPECGKCFIQKSNLAQHQRMHRDDKPFKCFRCGKGFILKTNLVFHERTHTGEKPYQCLECGKCFIKKSSLITHHETHHLGARPFTCSECDKSFRRKAHLVEHQRRHKM